VEEILVCLRGLTADRTAWRPSEVVHVNDIDA
jgi:hypothetical protein